MIGEISKRLTVDNIGQLVRVPESEKPVQWRVMTLSMWTGTSLCVGVVCSDRLTAVMLCISSQFWNCFLVWGNSRSGNPDRLPCLPASVKRCVLCASVRLSVHGWPEPEWSLPDVNVKSLHVHTMCEDLWRVKPDVKTIHVYTMHAMCGRGFKKIYQVTRTVCQEKSLSRLSNRSFMN